MKVYRIFPTAIFCCGAAYVAANDVEEAIKTFCEDDFRDHEYKYGECTCNYVTDMSYDIDKPFVIFDDLYLE